MHRANAEAVRKLERSQAAWRDDGARHVEAERDSGEQETAMWHSKAIRDEAIRVEAERIARGYGVRLADDDSTFAAKVKDGHPEQSGGCRGRARGGASEAIPATHKADSQDQERPSECRLSEGPSSSATDPVPEVNGKTASISRQVSASWHLASGRDAPMVL